MKSNYLNFNLKSMVNIILLQNSTIGANGSRTDDKIERNMQYTSAFIGETLF